MPVLAKSGEIVIRLMVGSTIGTRVHAFYRGAELVIAFQPLRVVQSEVPAWVETEVLQWIQDHPSEVFSPCCLAYPLPQDSLGSAPTTSVPPHP